MFIHPNYASNNVQQQGQSLTLLTEWVTRYGSHATLTLFLPLSHIFGMIIPLFNSAVWSRFTLVHMHQLPFCPISPPLIRLCVINNDRQKIAVHIGASRATAMPTPRSYMLNLLTKLLCIVFLLSAQRHCESGGIHFDWGTILHNGPALHVCTASQKRDHTTVALKGRTNEEIQSPMWAFIVSNQQI